MIMEPPKGYFTVIIDCSALLKQRFQVAGDLTLEMVAF